MAFVFQRDRVLTDSHKFHVYDFVLILVPLIVLTQNLAQIFCAKITRKTYAWILYVYTVLCCKGRPVNPSAVPAL